MGKAWSVMKRPILNYNVENRAHKFIEKQKTGKPIPAPRYPSEESRIKAIEDDIEIRREILLKNQGLVERIDKDINITAVSPPEPVKSERRLPSRDGENPSHYLDIDFRFYALDPAKIPRGKMSFKEATELFNLRYEQTGGTGSDAVPEHPARERVEHDKLQRTLRYFAPFEHTHRGYELWAIPPERDEMGQLRSRPSKADNVFESYQEAVEKKITLDERADKRKYDVFLAKETLRIETLKKELELEAENNPRKEELAAARRKAPLSQLERAEETLFESDSEDSQVKDTLGEFFKQDEKRLDQEQEKEMAAERRRREGIKIEVEKEAMENPRREELIAARKRDSGPKLSEESAERKKEKI